MSELPQERATSQPIGEWDATAYNGEGKRIEIPLCPKCGCLMLMCIAAHAFKWICTECPNDN